MARLFYVVGSCAQIHPAVAILGGRLVEGSACRIDTPRTEDHESDGGARELAGQLEAVGGAEGIGA